MATSYNIFIYQGDLFQATLSVKDSNNNAINLSGYEIRGQARVSYGSTNILLDLNPTITSHLSGTINITLDSEITDSLPIGQFVYDIERYPSGIPTGNSIKLMLGKFNVSPEVTR